MTLNKWTTPRFALSLSLILFTLTFLFPNVTPVFALDPDTTASPEPVSAIPNFSDFSYSVQNGDKNTLRGVYVPGVLALPIIQQPYGHAGFVSEEDNVTTQFRMASQYGNIGLLAHNYLAGEQFFNLQPGDEVRLIYGDGSTEVFVVVEALSYQALQPYSPYSSFRDLETDQVLSVEKMFKKVYFGNRHVTFQTCIEQDGNTSWGRLFIIAIPKAEYEELNPLNNL